MRKDAEREARATAVVAVMSFGDADEFLLSGRHMYRLEKLDQILMRLKVEYSGFGTLNNQRFSLVDEAANPYVSELRWLTQSCIFYILEK